MFIGMCILYVEAYFMAAGKVIVGIAKSRTDIDGLHGGVVRIASVSRAYQSTTKTIIFVGSYLRAPYRISREPTKKMVW